MHRSLTRFYGQTPAAHKGEGDFADVPNLTGRRNTPLQTAVQQLSPAHRQSRLKARRYGAMRELAIRRLLTLQPQSWFTSGPNCYLEGGGFGA